MLERKEETQDLPNTGQLHLKRHKRHTLGWGMRSSAGCVTGRTAQLHSPELPCLFWEGVTGHGRVLCHQPTHSKRELTCHHNQCASPHHRDPGSILLNTPDSAHQAPNANKQPHWAAVVAAATSKGGRQASACPPHHSASLCSCLCHFSRLLPRCSSDSCSQSRDHERK